MEALDDKGIEITGKDSQRDFDIAGLIVNDLKSFKLNKENESETDNEATALTKKQA